MTPPAKHLAIALEPGRDLVRATRKAEPIASAAEIEDMVLAVRAALGTARRRLLVLVDLRLAPLRDETDWVASMRTLRHELTRGVRGAAFLVETHVGRIQVARYLREEGIEAPVFRGEAEALAYLGVGRTP